MNNNMVDQSPPEKIHGHGSAGQVEYKDPALSNSDVEEEEPVVTVKTWIVLLVRGAVSPNQRA